MCLDEVGSRDASEWPVVSASSGSMDASEWSEVSASNTGPVEEQAGSSSWEKVKNTPNMGFAAEASRQRGDADCRHDSSDHEGGGSSAVQRLPAYDDRAHAPVVQSRGGAGSPDDLPANHSSKGGDRSSDRPSVGDNAVEVLQPPIGWSDGCDNPFVVELPVAARTASDGFGASGRRAGPVPHPQPDSFGVLVCLPNGWHPRSGRERANPTAALSGGA